MAILARTNKLAILYSETLYYHGINHFLVSQFDLFCLRVSQDFMAFLQTLERPTCRLPWLRMFAMSDKNMTLDKALHLINKCKEFGLHPHWVLNGTMDDNSYPPKQMIDTAMHGRLVVLDTETTGFDPLTCDIIQFAAVEIVQGKIGRTFEVFLKTDKALGDSVNIHHISKEYLDLNGIEREEGFRQILDFIDNSNIAAHNLVFDVDMLESNISQILGCSFAKGRIGYCTLETAIAMDPALLNHKLEYLIERYKLPGKNTHNARDDV